MSSDVSKPEQAALSGDEYASTSPAYADLGESYRALQFGYDEQLGHNPDVVNTIQKMTERIDSP